ncbi:MAG: hypothetical protein KDA21_15685, partial [Phycisphaerales bacterium]|nr:hypothetical protein [Phycisphaerales bacterium]
GVVAYELLAGRRPFSGKQLSAVIYQILHHDPDPLEQVVPECAPEVAALVARCLAKDRSQRPPSAEVVGDELAAAIGEILSESAIGRAPSLRPPAARPTPAPMPAPDLQTARLPAAPPPAEVTSGIRELALDPDAAADSGHLSGTRVLEMRGAPWGTVAATAGAILIAVLGVAGIVQMIQGRGKTAPPAVEATSPTEATTTQAAAQAPAGEPTAADPTKPEAPVREPVAPTREPEVAPEPAPATLSIAASWSPAATVEVAGRRLGLETSHDLELPPGDYLLSFEMTQPYPSRATMPVSLSAGDRRVIRPPFGRPGVITLQPQLGGAQGRISVDGAAAQVGVIRGLVLPPGIHQIRIEPVSGNDPTAAIDYQAEVLSGQELILTFDLARRQVTPVTKPINGG